jgi:hypothetical protein
MFEKIIYRLALGKARRLVRKQSGGLVNFTTLLNEAESFLVVMPATVTDDILSFMERLAASPRTQRLVVIAPNPTVKDTIEITEKTTVLAMDELAFKRKHLPNDDLIDRVRQEKADVALDLNTTFSLPAAYLTGMSGAVIKMGFPSDYSDFFFNFILQASLDGERYKHLGDYLMLPDLHLRSFS